MFSVTFLSGCSSLSMLSSFSPVQRGDLSLQAALQPGTEESIRQFSAVKGDQRVYIALPGYGAVADYADHAQKDATYIS